MNLDRFKAPTGNDELACCNGCDKPFHYTALDDAGLCEDCRPEPEPKTMNTTNDSDTPRTDAEICTINLKAANSNSASVLREYVLVDFARTLERELNEANTENADLHAAHNAKVFELQQLRAKLNDATTRVEVHKQAVEMVQQVLLEVQRERDQLRVKLDSALCKKGTE